MVYVVVCGASVFLLGKGYMLLHVFFVYLCTCIHTHTQIQSKHGCNFKEI